jgi:CRP-like cAMP-binding protein
VVYLVRLYVADYATLPHVRDEVLARLWYRFSRAGIEIPYPQSVVHLRQGDQRREATPEELLARLALFTPFPREEVTAIAASALPRRFGAGEAIVTEGRPGESFFVVVSGRVSIRGGKPEREVAVLGRGQTFGEMSLLTGEPRVATVVALEDVTLLELGREVFATHFAAHPERARQIAAVVAQRRAELSAVLPDAPEPVKESARVLERLKEIFGL